VQLQAFPFQMTAENLMRHADDPNAPFWEMLKTGSDAFSAEGLPPKVAVCNQRYVFNPSSGGKDLYPSAACPSGIDPMPATHARS
jgi:murein L,D-transpeptidase YafK